MIAIYWINESNFKLDFECDSDLKGQVEIVTQQLYALAMGWC